MTPEQLRVVLVEPAFGGNLGSTARAMTNLGVTDLRLIGGRANPESSDAKRMAVGGLEVLQAAQYHDYLAEAVADCALVVGTTARPRKHLGVSSSLWDLGPIAEASAQGGPVALVFGRERFGLTNDELALCSHQITIPTFSDYSSLNLAQAVLLVLYECSKEFGQIAPQAPERAKAQELEGLKQHLFEFMQAIGYLKTQKMRDTLWQSFSDLIARAALGPRDVAMIRGLFNRTLLQLGKKKDRN
ncbi:MAG: RNA methyltransferase [bacterium]|nr:RNA methyltransferase [bacterium]